MHTKRSFIIWDPLVSIFPFTQAKEPLFPVPPPLLQAWLALTASPVCNCGTGLSMIPPFAKEPEAKENEPIYIWTSEYILGGEQRGNPPQNNGMSQRKHRRGETRVGSRVPPKPLFHPRPRWDPPARRDPGAPAHKPQRISILKPQRDSSQPLAS